MAHAERRFEHARTGADAESLDARPQGLDHDRRRVVGVGSGCLEAVPFVVADEGAQVFGDVAPLARPALEDLRQRAPAAGAGQRDLLVGRGESLVGLDGLERAQGVEVALGLLAQAALADAGGGRDAEVALAREAARERVERGYSGCHSSGGATSALTVSITWS